MNETKLDNLCVCGHKKSQHKPLRVSEHPQDKMAEYIYYCRIFSGFLGIDRCKCDNFKQDNLKYLEQLYESRTSR